MVKFLETNVRKMFSEIERIDIKFLNKTVCNLNAEKMFQPINNVFFPYSKRNRTICVVSYSNTLT